MTYTVKFPISGPKIEQIKEVCGVPEELISVNKEDNTGVIRAETWVELLGICFGLIEPVYEFEVIDEKTRREVTDELLLMEIKKLVNHAPPLP